MFLLGPRVTVTHRRPERTSDGIGGFVDTWSTIETFDAIFNPISAKENIAYGKDTVTRLYKLYIEVDNRTITEQDRFYYNNGIYGIVGIENPFHNGLFYKVIVEYRKPIS